MNTKNIESDIILLCAGRAFDVFDDLLTSVFACSNCLSHLPLLNGYDESETLSYQMTLFGPIDSDVRHFVLFTSQLTESDNSSMNHNYFIEISDLHTIIELLLQFL